ncbi:MAG TPA: trypsin-like serine protease [Paraburkholderia sp.]|nr:trypsin-like serine protease [Paraburkholderia sp.]
MLTALATSLLMIHPAHAVIISDDLFTKNGGNLADLAGTLGIGMEPQRQASYAAQFLSVGHMNNCTSTWIGDTPDGKSSYVLTAAHCVEGAGATAPITTTFTDWAGRVVASGQGQYVLGPYRTNIPAGLGRMSTDIAVVRLPKTATILDQAGAAIPPPILYDGSAELNQPVWFAGYGYWSTGTGYLPQYMPPTGERRAAGTSTLDNFYENDYGVGASFSPQVGGKFSAQLSMYDSGSAWWQQQDGYWTIVATSQGTGTNLSAGARVSRYADWLRSVYPQAQFLSDRYTVTEARAIATPNFALEARTGSVGYVVPPQAGASGPTYIVWNGDSQPNVITVTMTEQSSKLAVPVKLRTWRDIGCGSNYYQAMNDAVSCYSNRSGPLVVSYVAADNPGLAPGNYRATFGVEAHGWDDTSYVRRLNLMANITVK